MRELWIRRIASCVEFGHAKSITGAKYCANVIGTADVVGDKDTMHMLNYKEVYVMEGSCTYTAALHHIVATGSKENLERLTDWCRVGPPKARVSNLDIKKLELQQFDRFAIAR